MCAPLRARILSGRRLRVGNLLSGPAGWHLPLHGRRDRSRGQRQRFPRSPHGGSRTRAANRPRRRRPDSPADKDRQRPAQGPPRLARGTSPRRAALLLERGRLAFPLQARPPCCRPCPSPRAYTSGSAPTSSASPPSMPPATGSEPGRLQLPGPPPLTAAGAEAAVAAGGLGERLDLDRLGQGDRGDHQLGDPVARPRPGRSRPGRC